MYAAPPHGRTCTAELQAASMYLRERDDREGVSSEVVCSVRVGELRGGMQSCHELGQWTRTSIRPHYRTWYCSSCIIWSEAGGSASTLGVCQLHSTREPSSRPLSAAVESLLDKFCLDRGRHSSSPSRTGWDKIEAASDRDATSSQN